MGGDHLWEEVAAIGQVPGSLAVLVAVGTDRSFGSIRIAREKIVRRQVDELLRNPFR